ncbi:MAG: tripartite tricarboxylate transporter substrate binding protein [Alphaproteobacteria bacterium]|nr:tripartite tricarboxylate transporter substrate binding protein [Alphaproteobacteria bacterium]
MKHLAVALSVALAVSALAETASAQTYPNRPIRMVVPYAPGGGVSVYAQLIGNKLNEILKQPVVIENRPGVGGNIGSEAVAKSPPDGYTVLIHTAALASAGPLYKSLPFNPLKDFAPVTNVVATQLILAGSLKSTASTLPELIAQAKANPGKLNYASSGRGSTLHLFAELLKVSAGVDIVHIPYRGDAPMITAVIAGEVQMAFLPQATGQGAVQDGRMRGLAITGTKRSPQLPNTPTLLEAGVKGFEVGTWTGIWMPAGTPPEIVSTFQQAVAKALADPAVAERFRSFGAEPVGNTPAEFAEFFKADVERYARIIEQAKIPKLD